MTDKNEYTVIGIDGGGTHTRGILRTGNKIIAHSKAGTTRIGAVGVGESCERLLNMIADLTKQAEIESSEIDAVIIGLAGVWLEDEKKRSHRLIKTLARSQDMVLNDIVVTSDAELAIEGAFEGGSGIIVIAGTGSIGLAGIGKGKYERCGGWGIELDDEGSGAWIGREGITAIVRDIDGRGMKTELTGIFAEMFPIIDINNPRTIVKAYAERAFEYHLLAPAIMKCAVNNDEVCLEIIKRAAYHLMELPEALLKHYKNKTVPIALMGGMIDAKTLLYDFLIEKIDKHKQLKLTVPKGTALDGAMAIGDRLLKDLM